MTTKEGTVIKNESGLDRVIRVVVGVIAAVAAILVGLGTVFGVVLVVVAVIAVVTAAVGFCPLYRLLGVSTCKVPERN
jgi:hypothetical protein